MGQKSGLISLQVLLSCGLNSRT